MTPTEIYKIAEQSSKIGQVGLGWCKRQVGPQAGELFKIIELRRDRQKLQRTRDSLDPTFADVRRRFLRDKARVRRLVNRGSMALWRSDRRAEFLRCSSTDYGYDVAIAATLEAVARIARAT